MGHLDGAVEDGWDGLAVLCVGLLLFKTSDIDFASVRYLVGICCSTPHWVL